MRLFFIFLLLVIGTHSAQAAKFGWSGDTVARLTQANGNQIYYFDKSGKAYVWQSGQHAIAVGNWFYRTGDQTNPMGTLCFNFSGRRSCETLPAFGVWSTQRTDGDVFGLARKGAVPFVLNRDRITFQQIARRIGTTLKSKVYNLEDYVVRPGGQKMWGEPLPSAPPPPITCQSELTKYSGNDRASKKRMAMLYFHGKVMGRKCVEVSYDKAFSLLREIGDRTTYRSLLDALRDKAATGNPRAKRALAKWGSK